MPKGESWSQALLAEMVETWDKNCNMSQQHALFCEESLGNIDAKDIEPFRNSVRSMGEVGGGRFDLKEAHTSVLRTLCGCYCQYM